jgi:hypothetical protein
MHFFIWHNNPFSKNKAKMFILRYQKLFTIYHFKSYLEIRLFNDLFFFYSVKRAKMLNYYELCSKEVEKTSFLYLLNKGDVYLQNIHLKENHIQYFNIYSYDYLLHYFSNLEILYGYRLLMQTPLVKFKTRFAFGRLSYNDYKSMLDNVYFLIKDKIRLQKFMKKKINLDLFFNMYNNIYINFYFLKDFLNLYNKNLLIRSFKILTFYDKIVSIIFMNLDPFFFKHF